MGVLHGRDLLSSKYNTAIITDASNRVFFMPIKYVIGDYFIGQIEKQTYVFKLDGSRKYEYRDTLVKSFRVMFYDLSHYAPISSSTKELELALVTNHLPKVDSMLFNIFKILGNREKNPFKKHKIKDLKEYIKRKQAESGDPDEFAEEALSIIKYLDHLNIDEIVTPLKKLAEFIEGDLITTQPQFLGSILTASLDAETEHRKLTNTPIGSKTAWMKWVAVMLLISLVGVVMYMAYEGGAFDSITGAVGGFGDFDFNIGGGVPGGSTANIMDKYPTPEALKLAIDRGDVVYNTLPDDIKRLVDGVKVPTDIPSP